MLLLPGTPNLGIRFSKTNLLKNAAGVDPQKISHLNGYQIRQRPQALLDAGNGSRGEALNQDDGHKAHQNPDAKNGSRQKSGQKVDSDNIGQSSPTRWNCGGLTLGANG